MTTETYPQYLKRVGSDYRASDFDSATADDYFEAADRLLTIRECLITAIVTLEAKRRLPAESYALARLRDALKEVDAGAFMRPTPIARTRERMNDCPDKKKHRRAALARANRCTTCKKGPCGYGDPRDGIAACIGCGELIGYYSCSPGYCVACAHDPCWVSFSEAVLR